MPMHSFISASQTKSLMVDGKLRPPFGRGAITYSRWLARDIVGIQNDEIESPDIDRGNELEDEAVSFFEATFFVEGQRPEFIIHPDIEFFGGTPDWMDSDFGIDIKCPNQKNHHDNIIEGIQLDDYKHQFQSYMAITGFKKWGLVSYNPTFTDNAKLAVSWMVRDEEYIKKLLQRVKLFYPIVMEEVEKLKGYKPKI